MIKFQKKLIDVYKEEIITMIYEICHIINRINISHRTYLLIILNCKIMFSGIISNDKPLITSPTNQGYKYTPNYFISKEKHNSTSKNVVNREYYNSHSKTTHKNISMNYEYPIWK